VARHLANGLRAQESIGWVQEGAGEDVERAVHDLYFPRRWSFLAASADERAARLSDDGLRRAADDLQAALAGPRGPLIRRIAVDDPLLIFPSILDRLGTMRQGDLTVVDGQFTTADGHAVIFFATQGSPCDGAAMQPSAETFDGLIAEASDSVDGAVTVEQSGVYRFALASEASIKRDVQRISIAST